MIELRRDILPLGPSINCELNGAEFFVAWEPVVEGVLGIPHIYAKYDHILTGIFRSDSIRSRERFLAGAAPSSPKIDNDDFATV